MKVLEITVYSFNELSKEAQQKAISNLYDINVDNEWWEFIYEDAKNAGLKITGFDLDRGSYCKGEFILSAHEVAANIVRDHGETCETFKTAQSFLDAVNEIQGKYEEFEGADYEGEMMDAESDFLNSLCEDYLTMLRKEYEYLTSDEAIKETIEASEYTFLADGRMKNS